jgi:hypothetical protein
MLDFSLHWAISATFTTAPLPMLYVQMQIGNHAIIWEIEKSKKIVKAKNT